MQIGRRRMQIGKNSKIPINMARSPSHRFPVLFPSNPQVPERAEPGDENPSLIGFN